jgi:CheY-like chemotaxis protein
MSGAATAVLIAHADEALAKRLADACRRRGLTATIALDGSAALEHALEHTPEAIVVQLALPTIDGPTLCGILAANPRTNASRMLLIAPRTSAASHRGEPFEVLDESDVATIANRASDHPDESSDGARDAARVAQEFEGELPQLPMLELLELLHGSRRTGELTVAGASGSGSVALRGGEIMRALCGRVDGEKAVLRLLTFERGHFRFAPASVTGAPSLARPTHALLREGRRQLEEWHRMRSVLPAASVRLRMRVPRSAIPAELPAIACELLQLLEHFDSVRELLDRCPHSDYQVLRAIQTMLDRGWLEAHTQLALGEAPGATGFLSDRHVARLEQTLRAHRRRGSPLGMARLVVAAESEAACARLSGLLARVPGAVLPRSFPGPDQLGRLATVRVGEDLGIEFTRVPASERLAALWPVCGFGALGVIVPLVPPLETGLGALRPLLSELAARRVRPFYAVLTDAGATAPALEIASALRPPVEGPLFWIPHDHPERGVALLRELIGSVLE